MSRTPTEAINSYITDMLALEDHIETAIKGQITDFEKDHPSFAAHLREIRAQTAAHIGALKALAARRRMDEGASMVEAVKRGTAWVAGAGAALVDFVRTEKLPKNLRDDYTAVNLGAISYSMLHTTAVALQETDVADLARRHMTDYAHTVMVLQKLIPASVIDQLRSEKMPVAVDSLTRIEEAITAVWREAAEGVPDADALVASPGA
jgi:hypothetical protein